MASHSDDGNLAKSAVGAASSLILLQLLSRLVTFGLNQALVRLASPEVFGTASIQFELLLSTILFLSREGFRNTLLRAPAANENSKGEGAHTKDRDAQLATNIAFLPVPAGTVVALTVTAIYRALSSYATRSQPHFDLSVALYAFAAICELLSEPFYIRAQNQLRFGVRVKAEGFAVILRTLATLAILVGVGGSWGLVAFSVGQAVYGLTILGAYLVTYGGFGQVLPRPVRQAESKQ